MAHQGAGADARVIDRPVWANEPMRIDPWQLPQRAHIATQQLRTTGITSSEITVDNVGAVLKRELDCGLPVSMALPSRSFQGVAARAMENADGSFTATLELRHHDADLSIPLCVGTDMEDIAADWHAWAKKFNLAMLLVDGDGQARIVKEAGAMNGHPPTARRRRTTTLKHRPNFLRRRAMGQVGEVVKLEATEIIARN